MSIELVTGLPGHFKTLLTIHRYRDIQKKTGRAVYYHGIKGLKLDWVEWEPKDWEKLPPRSIFIIDEAQFIFPVRGRGSPEEFIERLAVHRHAGIDIVLITQNPMLIDSFVRRLVDRHWHSVRKFGTLQCTLHEFPNGVKENVGNSRAGSVRHEFRAPKELFDLYTSAEAHTVTGRVPLRVFMLLALIPAVLLLGWFIFKRGQPEAVAERMAAPAGAASSSALGGGLFRPGTGVSVAAPAVSQVVDAGGYVALYQPRIDGLPHTAPAYDEVTKPVDAPRPAACVASAVRCTCYSQQATVLQMGDALCRSLVERGFFQAWASEAAGPVRVGDGPKRLALGATASQ